MRRLLVWGMLAVALSACSPPDKTDLLSLPIPGVEFFPFRDESSVPLMETAAELAERFVERGQNAVSMRQRWLPTPQPPMKILHARWMNCWGQAGNAARDLIPAGRIFTSWSGKPQDGINVFMRLQPGMKSASARKAARIDQYSQCFRAIEREPVWRWQMRKEAGPIS